MLDAIPVSWTLSIIGWRRVLQTVLLVPEKCRTVAVRDRNVEGHNRLQAILKAAHTSLELPSAPARWTYQFSATTPNIVYARLACCHCLGTCRRPVPAVRGLPVDRAESSKRQRLRTDGTMMVAVRKSTRWISVTAVILLLGSGCTASSVSAGPASPTLTTTSAAPTSTAPTRTPTPTPTPTPTSLGAVEFYCGGGPSQAEYAIRSVQVALDGKADYASVWALQVGCDNHMVANSRVSESVVVSTPLQVAVVAAAKLLPTYKENSDTKTLYNIYRYCAGNNPQDSYATMDTYSDSQILELKAWMTLCPNHPQAAKWLAGIAATEQDARLVKDGLRVYDGSSLIPSQMKPGTWVATNVKDCYWETRDANGKILANNFVTAAPRVQATVSSKAVVFNSEDCGQWNRI